MNPKYCCEVEPENMPDFVAVVRCKDCKHGYSLTDGAYYACTKPFAEPNNRKPFDWFCADGQR